MPGSVTKTYSMPRLPIRREPQHIHQDVASSNNETLLAGRGLLLVEDANQDLELARIRPPVDEVMMATTNYGRAIATRRIRSATPCPDDSDDALSPPCPRTPDPDRFQASSPSLGEWSSSDDSDSESSMDCTHPPSTPRWDRDESQPETMAAEPPLMPRPPSSVPATPGPERCQPPSPVLAFAEESPPSAFVSKDALLPSWGRKEDSSNLQLTPLQTMTEPDASQAAATPEPSSDQATDETQSAVASLLMQTGADSRPPTPGIGNVLAASPALDDLLSPNDWASKSQWPVELAPLEEERERSQPALMHEEDIPTSWGMSEGAADLQFTELMPPPKIPHSKEKANIMTDSALGIHVLIEHVKRRDPRLENILHKSYLKEFFGIGEAYHKYITLPPTNMSEDTVDELKIRVQQKIAQTDAKSLYKRREKTEEHLKNVDIQQNKIAQARSAMEAEDPAEAERAAVPPIEAGEQNSEKLRPLTSEDMTALATAVMFDPQLNVAAWASNNGIIPDHATACITDGALRAAA